MLLQRVQPDGPRLRLLLDDHLGAGPRLLRLADRPHPLPNLRHPPPVQGLLRWVRPSHRHRLRGNSSTPRLCRERRRRDSHVLINPCLSNSFRPPYPSMTIVDALSFITFCCAKHFSNCYSFLCRTIHDVLGSSPIASVLCGQVWTLFLQDLLQSTLKSQAPPRTLTALYFLNDTHIYYYGHYGLTILVAYTVHFRLMRSERYNS